MTPLPCRTLTRPCPAKLNLALSVGPAERPHGFHPIASWMVALEWGDALRLEAVEGDASGLTIAFAADAPQPQPVDWPLERDLAWRAHALMERYARRPLPIRGVLEKRIPAGAGLGGGSSDAAAMLLGLNELFELDMRTADLVQASRELGSDVAFLVAASAGEPSMLVTGYGETLTPMRRSSAIHAVIFLPAAKCPTGDVYRAFDDGGAAVLDEARVRRLAGADNVDPADLFNDLTEPAMRVTPSLRELHARLQDALNVRVHVTGSGAAMFAIAPAADAARRMAEAAVRNCGVPSVATRVPPFAGGTR